MADKLNINQWAEEDRPREKLERLGPQSLSDAELLPCWLRFAEGRCCYADEAPAERL